VLFIITLLFIAKSMTLKGNSHPVTGHEGPDGEWKYSSIPSFTSTQGGGEIGNRPLLITAR
jgi:hypothetical protein